MNEYAVGAICGAVFLLGVSFVVDILIPGLLSPVPPPSAVQPEDVRPLTDTLSAIARDLRAEEHPAALAVEHAALDALNLERKARGFDAIPAPEPLLPPRLVVVPDVEPIPLPAALAEQRALWPVSRS